jgi:hypothetical protein
MKVASRKCLECHAKLDDYCSQEITTNPNNRASITSFANAHPDFVSLSKDSGTVLFDHHQHMQPGQVNPKEKGGFTLEMLTEASRAEYANRTNTDGLIQLICADCHKLEDAAPTAKLDRLVLSESISMVADRELGRYMKPIDFDRHCSACHTLNAGIESPNAPSIPHAVPWNKLNFLLAAALNGARATGAARLPRDDTRQTPQPGESHGDSAPDGFRVSDDEIENSRNAVRMQCLKCHTAESIDETTMSAKPNIPKRWLRFGLFDHSAHRELDCKSCHAEADPSNDDITKTPPTDHLKVMIANRESCVGCHRPAETPTPPHVLDLTSSLPMWASDNCTLCHRYHDHPSSNVNESPNASGVAEVHR